MESWQNEFFSEEYLEVGLASIESERTAYEVDFAIDYLKLQGNEKVLDLCCGIGRHVNEFALRGFNITGLDFCQKYLDFAKKQAQEKDLNPELVCGDMLNLPFEENSFDAATCFLTSFGYFSEEENLTALKELAKVLKPGAFFLLEIANRDGLLKNYLSYTGESCGDYFLLRHNQFDLGSSRDDTVWRYFKDNQLVKEYFSSVRLYSFHEISALLEKAGFGLCLSMESLEGDMLTSESDRMYLISKKL